jgi:hypothetical protein
MVGAVEVSGHCLYLLGWGIVQEHNWLIKECYAGKKNIQLNTTNSKLSEDMRCFN